MAKIQKVLVFILSAVILLSFPSYSLAFQVPNSVTQFFESKVGTVLGVKYNNFEITALSNNAKTSIVKLKQMGLDSNGILVNSNSGTGVWVGKNLILTSAHVVTLEDDYGYLPSIIKVSLTQANGSLLQIANARVIAYDKKMDIALLYAEFEEYTNASQADFNNHGVLSLSANNFQGQKVTVAGYPTIGGDTLTSTEGTISGEMSKNGVKYLKTDSTVGLGSSGSPVLDQNNKIVGILTKASADVVSGQTGYMISAESILPWFNKVKNNSIPDYNKELKAQRDFQDEWYSYYYGVIPNILLLYVHNYPAFPQLQLEIETDKWQATGVTASSMLFDYLGNNTSSDLSVTMFKLPFNVTLDKIKKINLRDNPTLQFTEENLGRYMATKMVSGNEVSYGIPFRNYVIYLNYVSSDSAMSSEIAKVINSFTISDRSTPPANVLTEFNDTEHSWSITTNNNWNIIDTGHRTVPVRIINSENPKHHFSISISKMTEAQKNLTLENWENNLKIVYSLFGKEYNSVIYNGNMPSTKVAVKIESTNEIVSGYPLYTLSYTIPKNDLVMTILYNTYDLDEKNTYSKQIQSIVENNIQLFKFGLNTSDLEEPLVSDINYDLANNLKGKILLQVERNGEAWYVDPDNTKKYYLQDGPAAYEALRAFGLGISNRDIQKIPVGLEDRFQGFDNDGDGLDNYLEEALGTDPNNPDSDGDGYNDHVEVKNGNNPLGSGKNYVDNTLVNNLKGRILLQVERNGEAWYVNPKDGKRYYMANGEMAYQIMRFLSLGISNENLRKIPVGRF